MKNKIIVSLLGLILALLLSFQSYRLSIRIEENKVLKQEIEIINKKQELNRQDLLKQKEELKESNEEREILQTKLKKIFKNNSCVNTVVPNSFVKLLQE